MSDVATDDHTREHAPGCDDDGWDHRGPCVVDEGPFAPVSPRLFPVQQEQLTSDDYYTPRWVFDRMGIRFDLDVCAPPGGVEWVPADRYYDQAADGLASPWGGRVWMNPPYSQAVRWVPRFIEHRHGVCLLPHAKSSWHPTIWREADGIVTPDQRVNFLSERSNGEVAYPLFFAAFGDECVEAIGRLGVVRRADSPVCRPCAGDAGAVALNTAAPAEGAP